MLVSRLDANFAKSGNQPPSVSEVVEMIGDELYRYLLSMDELVEISSSVVFRKKELTDIIAKTKEQLASGVQITVADFRDTFNTTRKYAVALLEYMDDLKITRRVDDFRILNNG
jgi:selenocysteine-specific elongation factor